MLERSAGGSHGVRRYAIGLCLGWVAILGSGCAAASDGDAAASAAIELGPDLTPAYWNVDALADSPSPGSEPINVIITTNIPMDDIVRALPATRQSDQQGLLTWAPVQVGVGLKGCISEERALIDGEPALVGRDTQEVSLRLGGCEGIIFDGESHARGWKSAARSQGKDADGNAIETWYFALSQEHLCLYDNGTLLGGLWHCILPEGFVGTLPGINGKKFTAPTGGYNQGRDQFAVNLQHLVDANETWTVDCTSIPRADDPRKPNGGGAGEGLMVPISARVAANSPDTVEVDPRDSSKRILKRVHWDDSAKHCTIMRKSASQ
jgi:hypothetical protein